MFSWFTSKSVQRTNDVMKNPFSVYDLSFLEWEQRDVILQQQKVYLCKEKVKKSISNSFNQNYIKFEVIFKKDRLLIFSIYRDLRREGAEGVFKSVKTILNLVSDGITSTKPTVVSPILRDIVVFIRTHHNWTSAHIAGKVGLDDLFINKTPHVVSDLNTQTPPDMSTPLHLALESGRISTTKAVLALKPKLDLKDEFGNSAIHLAAMSEKDILKELLKEPNAMEMLKWTNNKGCTPLHLSCFAQKFENVIKLLEFGLTVKMMTLSDPKKKPIEYTNGDKIINFKKEDIEDLDTEDMQYGGTPLHWVKHRRALERLIGYGFKLDVKNVLGETALHTMVKRMRLKCMIGLLCFGAKVTKVNKKGDSPLHLAVKIADVTSTQALIVFDSKIDAKNKNIETPRHIAAQTEMTDHHMVLYLLSAIGAKRCPPDMKGCKIGCIYDGNYEGKPYHRWPTYDNEIFYKKVLLEPIIKEALNQSKHKTSTNPTSARLLCLDGGGIRGLITVQMLMELEKRLEEPICNFFDWIAGTSTGSILALLLSTSRSLREMRAIYFRFKDKILVGSRPFSSENFETLLEEEIGSNFTMADVKNKHKKHLIIFAVLIDRNPAKLHLFRSYESPEQVLGIPDTLQGFKVIEDHKKQRAWKACRASGAAPTYFRASESFIDGGFIANNPTLDSMTEFKYYNNALRAVGRVDESKELDLILSIGTGRFAVTPSDPIDLVKIYPRNPREIQKSALYARQMFNLLVNQVCATENHVTDRAQSWSSGIKTPYFRVNPLLSEVISLDETSDVEICNAMWETKAFMYAMRAEVDKIIQLIKPKQQSPHKHLPSTDEELFQKEPTLSHTINITENEIQIHSKSKPLDSDKKEKIHKNRNKDNANKT